VCVHCARNGIGTWVHLLREEGEEASPLPLASWGRAYIVGLVAAAALGLGLALAAPAALAGKAPSIQYIIPILAPATSTMRIMSSRTEIFLFESRLFLTARRIMMVFCGGRLHARFLVVISATIFLTTYPTPRAPTSLANMEFVPEIHATRKHVITCSVLQTPPLTPRALFRIS